MFPDIISSTSNAFGGNVGLFLKTNLTNNLAIQVEFLGLYRNAEFTILDKEHTLMNWNIEVLAYVMGQIAMSSGRFFFAASPYGIAGISATMGGADMYDENNGMFTLSR